MEHQWLVSCQSLNCIFGSTDITGFKYPPPETWVKCVRFVRHLDSSQPVSFYKAGRWINLETANVWQSKRNSKILMTHTRRWSCVVFTYTVSRMTHRAHTWGGLRQDFSTKQLLVSVLGWFSSLFWVMLNKPSKNLCSRCICRRLPGVATTLSDSRSRRWLLLPLQAYRDVETWRVQRVPRRPLQVRQTAFTAQMEYSVRFLFISHQFTAEVVLWH